VHEAPPLRDLDATLEAGDVVAVEPGLYLAGLGGVRVEDTVHVGKDGCESLSSLPRSLDPRAYL
jgi:Xaa-Pro aminopeptidase